MKRSDIRCDGAPAQTTYARRFNHEQIASFCLRSDFFGGEEGFSRAERDWAQSEVGESVEELWDSSWNVAGRYISTLAPDCVGDGIPAYFHALQQLHARFKPGALLDMANVRLSLILIAPAYTL